jgi:hypothetical protein
VIIFKDLPAVIRFGGHSVGQRSRAIYTTALHSLFEETIKRPHLFCVLKDGVQWLFSGVWHGSVSEHAGV